MDATQFRALVDGSHRGISASLARAGLRLAEIPYRAVVQTRNALYDRELKTVHRMDVPVISVGNLTLGGTGKTPLVAWVARWLREHDMRVTLISRGYGAQQGSRNDEALELEELLPDVPHLQGRDRVAAARVAVEEFECQMLLLDDGFQHRRLDRDLDIVLLDALDPFGLDHVFPRGFLREPLANLARADTVVLSRADLIDSATRQRIHQRVDRYAPHAVWAEARHQPRQLIGPQGRLSLPLSALDGRRVAAFCGLGNPTGFRRTLEQLGYSLVGWREFPDHHAYGRANIDELAHWAETTQADALLCTHKDLVKVGIDRLGGRPLWALSIGLELLSGQADLEAQLTSLLPTKASHE